jgi:hypothetical protein
MPSAKPRWPKSYYFEGKLVVSSYDADCLIADLFRHPKPPKPQKVEPVSPLALAERLGIAEQTVRKRLRERRLEDQAAADSQAPDRDQAAA